MGEKPTFRHRTMIGCGADRIPPPFHTELQPRGETIVVIASGEIDLTSADSLRAQLHDLLTRFRRVVVDLQQVDFIDSTGLHCLLEVDAASRQAGVELVLIRGPQQVQRLFQVTNTEGALRFSDGGSHTRRSDTG